MTHKKHSILGEKEFQTGKEKGDFKWTSDLHFFGPTPCHGGGSTSRTTIGLNKGK